MPTFSGGKDGIGLDGCGSRSRVAGDHAEKERVALRLEPDVLRKFKDAEDDWQQLINATLRRALDEEDED